MIIQFKWSTAELIYLVNMFSILSIEQLAMDLNKPVKTVQKQIDSLALNTLKRPQNKDNIYSSITSNKNLTELLIDAYRIDKGQSVLVKKLTNIKSKFDNPGQSGYKRLNKGFKKDIGVSIRSGWEGNVLRWLTLENKVWQYEPRVFFFEDIKHGTVCYTPDVYIETDDTWLEVKGHLPAKDKTKIRRFKKYYPEEFAKLKAVVGGPKTAAAIFYQELNVPILVYYNDLKKLSKMIPGWE